MPTILTRPEQVAEAEMADLLATYTHYAGRAVAGFSSRALAERRVADAMAVSADARGHLGVPKGTRPAPTGVAELVQRASDTGRADPAEMAREGLPGPLEGLTLAPGTNPYPSGSLASRLWAGAPAPPARPPVPAAPPAPRPAAPPRAQAACPPGDWVAKASGTPTARLNKHSERAAVYDYVAAADGPCGVAAVVARFGPKAKGHLSKLRVTKHIIDVPPPTKENAP